MLSVEIKVNGNMIGHIYVRNMEKAYAENCKYYYEYYKPENRELVKGNIQHKIKDGAEVLITKILNEVIGIIK